MEFEKWSECDRRRGDDIKAQYMYGLTICVWWFLYERQCTMVFSEKENAYSAMRVYTIDIEYIYTMFVLARYYREVRLQILRIERRIMYADDSRTSWSNTRVLCTDCANPVSPLASFCGEEIYCRVYSCACISPQSPFSTCTQRFNG